MTPLFSPEGLAGVVFLGFILLTAIGGLIATNAGNLIRAVSGLALCLVGVAGLYYFLGSPFLALMQLLIYAGAVCIAMVFAIMLAEPAAAHRLAKRHPLAGPAAIITGAIFAWGLAALALRTEWQPAAARINQGELEAVGRSMITDYVLAFELISLVLLVAIIGSLVLAKAGRSKA